MDRHGSSWVIVVISRFLIERNTNMIIWNGLGFCVFLIGFGSLILAELISEAITCDDRFYQQHAWVAMLGMFFAATVTYGFHFLLLRRKDRTVVDKETGEEFVLRSDHSLFFIPVRWWPVVFVIGGIVYAFSKVAE